MAIIFSPIHHAALSGNPLSQAFQNGRNNATSTSHGFASPTHPSLGSSFLNSEHELLRWSGKKTVKFRKSYLVSAKKEKESRVSDGDSSRDAFQSIVTVDVKKNKKKSFSANSSNVAEFEVEPIQILEDVEKKDKKEKKEKKEKKNKGKENVEPNIANVQEVIQPEIEEDEKEKKKNKHSKDDKYKSKVKAIKFVKYQGIGNDFILVDNLDFPEPKISPEIAIKICDRNFGIGGDGVIFALPGKDNCDYTMRIFNSDGSEPEMCGNGIRCLAKFVADLNEDKFPVSYSFSTLAGPIVTNIQIDGQVSVDMGAPILKFSEIPTNIDPSNREKIISLEPQDYDAHEIMTGLNLNDAVIDYPLQIQNKIFPVTLVSMGNPHCVVFLDSQLKNLDLELLDLKTIGPLFENHVSFPARINTEFVQVISPSELRMRVWERGAGETLACGTGACALVVAAVISHRAQRKCLVHLPGGPLEIEWNDTNGHVIMTGPAQKVFSGKFIPLFST